MDGATKEAMTDAAISLRVELREAVSAKTTAQRLEALEKAEADLEFLTRAVAAALEDLYNEDGSLKAEAP